VVKNEALFGAGYPKTTYVLSRNISAIQVIPEGSGRMRLGTIHQLPDGAEVEICGEGFNDRTKKVFWEGGFYYVFTEDLEAGNLFETTAWAAC
jgi:hypothetical protein